MLKVIATTSEQYRIAFGFTEEEAFDALSLYGMSSQKKDVKAWYNGFIFGEQRGIYNPWSITNHLLYVGCHPLKIVFLMLIAFPFSFR